MRHTRSFNFAPLAALGAGSLAGYYLVVRPWAQWSETRTRDRARGHVPSPRPSPRGRGGAGQVSTPSSFRG